ncbi:hypothetical protein NEMBOFW57_006698 [Staphylotrichum longicolle]|uniref:Heterokaryon incompatibility domain-containing protein n=1 Tax=Staphylotrichum longicolle TaxID=669026 RepID=A0AAD4HZT1_9PEZI|nr:hypothetical protein NEMBOFW57_006698 [Staphylotrichum longicolle]
MTGQNTKPGPSTAENTKPGPSTAETATRPQPERYQYTPLDTSTKEIRLLTLYAGARDDDIRISLHTASLIDPSNPPVYETLSYVWGSEANPQPIYVVDSGPLPDKNDKTRDENNTTTEKKTLLVTQNLVVALRHLRELDKPQTLWIDAVCIDQANFAERGAQVALMGEIYWRACHTVIWLGPTGEGDDDSDYALSLLQTAAHVVDVDWHVCAMRPSAAAMQEARAGNLAITRWADQDALLPVLAARQQRALNGLFGRPWFERLWVRQEVFLSRSKSLICGGLQLQWESLRDGVFCFYRRPYLTVTDEFDAEFLFRRTRVYELCRGQRHWMVYGTLRHQLRDLRWKDPRDAIYAVKHLLSPAHRALEFTPDYARPAGDVFGEVATRLATECRDISFLASCELESSSLACLPTWVPDWSAPMKCASPIEPIWSACSWISAHAECVNTGVLRVAGIHMATIEIMRPADSLNGSWLDRDLVVDTVKTLLPPSREALDAKYVGGGTLLEAYCLALHRGRTSENFDTPNGGALSMAEAKNALLSIFEMTRAPARGELEHDDPLEMFLATANGEMDGRCFVSTTEGYIGLAPAAARPGDIHRGDTR